jgi:hypothetical protein
MRKINKIRIIANNNEQSKDAKELLIEKLLSKQFP